MRPLARGTGASKPVFSFVKVLLDRVRTYVCIRVQFDLTLCPVKCTPIFVLSIRTPCVYIYMCVCVCTCVCTIATPTEKLCVYR